MAKGKNAKAVGILSTSAGGLSFLGSWQVCHNLCIGIIAALSLIGITIVGMPLLFLNQYAIYFWFAACLLLAPTLFLYWKNRKCISKNLLFFNFGIVIASIPFAQLQNYHILFWAVGGIFILAAMKTFLEKRIGQIFSEQAINPKPI